MSEFSEKRADFPRVLRGFTVVLDTTQQVCVLVDASSKGGQLKLEASRALPKEFKIVFAGAAMPVTQVWRSADNAGFRCSAEWRPSEEIRRRVTGVLSSDRGWRTDML